jgi:hypothetical protein
MITVWYELIRSLRVPFPQEEIAPDSANMNPWSKQWERDPHLMDQYGHIEKATRPGRTTARKNLSALLHMYSMYKQNVLLVILVKMKCTFLNSNLSGLVEPRAYSSIQWVYQLRHYWKHFTILRWLFPTYWMRISPQKMWIDENIN